MIDSRKFVESIEAGLVAGDDGRITLTSPRVGLWREAPQPGTPVVPGAYLGEIESLGRRVRLLAPARAYGMVLPAQGDGPRLARQPVDFGAQLLVLDPEGVSAGAAAEATATDAASGPVFRAPTSGRFYSRPSPDKPAFVEEGQIIETGQTVALLEVMKTFNRIAYGGAGLPKRARVLAIVPADESDLASGDPILKIEAVE